jgi:hypothetical protein
MSGSLVTKLIDRVRFYMDDPGIAGKYTDNDLLNGVILEALQEMWTYVNMNADNPLMATFDLSVVTTQDDYILPPSVSEVWRLGRVSADDSITDFVPEKRNHPLGPGWFLQGNMLSFDPSPTRDQTHRVFYVPIPDASMHRATDGTLDATLSIITLSSSPATGEVDDRDNGYLGQVVRLLSSTGSGGVEVRTISAHSVTAGTITVPVAFSSDHTAGAVSYEIVPVGTTAFLAATALGAALKLATARRTQRSTIEQLLLQYRLARRAEGQRLSNLMARTGKYHETLTTDRTQIGLSRLWGNAS